MVRLDRARRRGPRRHPGCGSRRPRIPVGRPMIDTHPPTRAWTGEARFQAALAHAQPDRTPVWFMRQAGRCLADYRKLRETHPILTLAKTPELCAEVTVMPVDAFGVDAAVLFADIMLPLEPMGVSLEIQPEIGPIIHAPIRSRT